MVGSWKCLWIRCANFGNSIVGSVCTETDHLHSHNQSTAFKTVSFESVGIF